MAATFAEPVHGDKAAESVPLEPGSGLGPSRGFPAPKTRTWNHNGSIMRLVSEGASRRFYYENPREGLLREGVGLGTLLFEGTRLGGTYSGTAYVFSRECGRRGYSVSGTISNDDRVVTMVGQAPRLNSACEVIGYRPDTLVFEYLEP